MRLPPRAALRALACGFLGLCACDTGEPPPLDSGVVVADAATDAGLTGVDGGAKDVSTVDVTVRDAAQAEASAADHQAAADVAASRDVVTEAARDAPPEAARGGADAGLCGARDAACPFGTTCASGVCTVSGQALGQLCGAASACPAGSACNAKGYCSACGGPGQPCCDTGTCSGGGCCVEDVCTPSGSVCPFTNGGLCESSSCGHACADGGCGVCGGPGQACCATVGCTASEVECVTTTGTDKVCAACGDPGEPCCGGTACAGASVVCSGGTCAACGGAGEPCCTAGDAGACGGALSCVSFRCQ